jgi:hypothetical protein
MDRVGVVRGHGRLSADWNDLNVAEIDRRVGLSPYGGATGADPAAKAAVTGSMEACSGPGLSPDSIAGRVPVGRSPVCKVVSRRRRQAGEPFPRRNVYCFRGGVNFEFEPI